MQCNATERVRNAILGKEVDRTPIYGWVAANLSVPITDRWGSVAAFEDAYEFDMAHLFAGPASFHEPTLAALRERYGTLTPDILCEADIFTDPDRMEDYDSLRAQLTHHKAAGRERFCYIQTPGFFEHFNGIFGIENQLLYLAMYPDELEELYRRQRAWTLRFADQCIDAGVDMIHVSDDWGAQKDMLFSPRTWEQLIYPNVKALADHVHARASLISLHSDGCISKVAHRLPKVGFDLVHPWQESAGMGYDFYLQNFADSFAILGGVCVQTCIGLLPQEKLEQQIRRVFGLLKGHRWICCTTHYVQSHCTVEDLRFAYDLIYRLARE